MIEETLLCAGILCAMGVAYVRDEMPMVSVNGLALTRAYKT